MEYLSIGYFNAVRTLLKKKKRPKKIGKDKWVQIGKSLENMLRGFDCISWKELACDQAEVRSNFF